MRKAGTYKRFVAMLMIVAMTVMLMPGMNIQAASASLQVVQNTSADSIYTDQVVTVRLDITGKSGTTGNVVPTDIVLIVDQSGSMEGDKLSALKPAAINFINSINMAYHRIAVIGFQSNLATTQSFTTDKTLLCDTINNIQAGGGTYVAPAITEAVNMLKNDRRTGASPAMIVLTDGAAMDDSAAVAAAKVARDNSFTFYTIGLFVNEANASVPGTAEYQQNELLKSLATTAYHHHFVGASGLQTAYERIANDIGKDKPRNVEVVQTIGDEFELVAGSADASIPKPTINGKTLTWSMLEVSDSTFAVEYQIKPKKGISTGKYPNISQGTYKYEFADGTIRTGTISPKNIEVLEIPKFEGTMSPESGYEQKEVTVKVAGTGLYYGSGFKVLFGGQQIQLSKQTPYYFEFIVPKTVAIGNYDVVVYNGDGSMVTNVGTYVCKERPDFELISIKPTSGIQGEETLVRVDANYMDYDAGFHVYLGGKEVKLTYTANGYFKFYTPKDLALGIHNIEVKNGIKPQQVIGTFECKELKPDPVPAPVFEEMTPTSGIEKTKVAVRVNVSSITYASDAMVEVNGIPVKLDYKAKSYFRFSIPETLTKGEYEVVFINGGQRYSIDKYTAIEKSVPTPVIGEMTPKTGIEKTKVNVRVNVSNVSYGTDAAVEVGGTQIKLDYKAKKYFRFSIPETLTKGEYDVVFINNGQKYPIDKYTAIENPVPVPVPVIGEMNPKSGLEKTKVTVRVNVSNLSYGTDAAVKVNGTLLKLDYKAKKYFRFTIPDTLTKGDYEVKLVNNGVEYDLGTYTAIEKVVPQPVFGSLSATSGSVGSKVRVNVSNLTYGGDVAIMINGVSYKLAYKCASYFRFNIPSIPKGTYGITFINNGQSYNLGDYTIK